MTKVSFYEELEQDIKNAYLEPVSPEQAERLAAKFLLAQLEAGRELAALDLDARIKKTGVKAEKAKVYLETAKSGDKKPSDVLIGAVVDVDSIVLDLQKDLDKAEVQRDLIENYLNIFKEAHIYMRNVSRGRFE